MFPALPILFLVVAAASGVGDIWVRTDPGVTVTLDGVRMGVTTAEERGMWLRALKPGSHQLVMEVAGGAAKTMRVDVMADQITTVEVSSIALRAGRKTDKSSIEIRLQPQSLTNCSATLGARREQLLPVTVVDDLSAGRHRLAVSCGDRSLRKDVEVAVGRTVIVEADFAAGGMVVLGDRPRIADLVVTSRSRDLIVKASLPRHAKLALASVLAPGVELTELQSRGSLSVIAVFETPTCGEELDDLLVALRETGEVKKIEARSARRLPSRRCLIELFLVFRE